MANSYRIGTRDSLLALTQSGQVKAELERLTGKQFELVPFKTRGDLNTSAPLWQLEGENFFTKELDTALIAKKVDFVVHSYKDLGSKRPDPLTLAAITKRQFAHDILIARKNISDKEELIIGTSSPRRIANVEKSLSAFLPHHPKLKCESIRGNVNTRLQKLRDGKYDATILALAGLERLAIDPTASLQLKELLKDLNFMVLPLSIFPSAAAQGALAIECLKENSEILELVKSVHDSDTETVIKREREAFNNYGGGCHLAVGINVKKVDEMFIHTHKGFHEQEINKSFIEARELPRIKNPKVFIGIDDPYTTKTSLTDSPSNDAPNKIVTSKYCLEWLEKNYKGEFLWAAGSKTMQRLADQNLWVCGSLDSLGESELATLLESKTIQMLLGGKTEVTSLSHDQANSIFSTPIATYTHNYNQDISIEAADVYYWTSFRQYNEYKKKLGPSFDAAIHCCGLGKTFQLFKENKINVTPFSSMEEFKKWIEAHHE